MITMRLFLFFSGLYVGIKDLMLLYSIIFFTFKVATK